MSVPCLVRVLTRADRQLLRLYGDFPADIKRDVAERLGVDAGKLVIVHRGNILLDDNDLSKLKQPSSEELGLVAFVLNLDQCRMAESAKQFQPILPSPIPSPPQPISDRNVILEIPVHNALEFLGRHVSASLREPLIDMGFPEARVVKALLLNGLSVERAMEWLLDHSNDDNVDEPLNPYQVSHLIASLVSSQANLVLSGGSASGIIQAVEAAVARRQCTFAVTRHRYVPQRFRCCNTCSFVNGRGVCLSCAAVCHAGHDLSEEILGEGFFCDCGSGAGNFTCQCLDLAPQSQPTPRIFSNRMPFSVSDLTTQSQPTLCEPLGIRLNPPELAVVIDLLRRMSASAHAQISQRDIGIVALLLDVIDQIPVHIIGLFATIVRQKQGVERIMESDVLSNSLIPRITSVCIESNVQVQILRVCLAFSINLSANAFEQKQWYSYALSSFSHMISVCSTLICNGSAIESLFAIELLGNYALLSPHIAESQRRTLLSELLNGAASRTENATLLLKILIALGTMMELVPSVIPIARQLTDLGRLFDQLIERWPNVMPAIVRFREMVDRSP